MDESPRTVQAGMNENEILYQLQIINQGVYPIAWSLKICHMIQRELSTPCGILAPGEHVLMGVQRNKVIFPQQGNQDECLVIVWTNRGSTINGPAEQHAEWFQGEAMVRRRNIAFDYQPLICVFDLC